jgi:hypothetical protein
MSGSIKVQNIKSLALLPGDGYLQTAAAINANLQNVTDKLGNQTPIYIGTESVNIMPINAVDSVIIGNNSGLGGTSNSSIIGVNSFLNGTGADNILIGKQVFEAGTTGNANVSLGHISMLNHTTSTKNVAIGWLAFAAGITGDFNTFIGDGSGHRQNGNYNVAIGSNSHFGNWPTPNNTGNNNISIGNNANHTLEDGSFNICIGVAAYASTISANNELNIGNSLYAININNGGTGTPGTDPQFAIGKTTPGASAILDLNSTTTRGFILPSITTTQRNAIASPANGLQVYDITLSQMCFYSAAAGGWRKITDSPA